MNRVRQMVRELREATRIPVVQYGGMIGLVSGKTDDDKQDPQMKLVKSRPKRQMPEIPNEARKILHCVGLALLLLASVVHAGTVPQAPQVGDTYELTLVKY
jgi:hypothetical protein